MDNALSARLAERFLPFRAMDENLPQCKKRRLARFATDSKDVSTAVVHLPRERVSSLRISVFVMAHKDVSVLSRPNEKLSIVILDVDLKNAFGLKIQFPEKIN